MTNCHHTESRSGIARYSREAQRLRFVEVCDHCGAECREVEVVRYVPCYQRGGATAAAA